MADVSHAQLLVLAGPNGAGKSTCAAGVLPARFPVKAFVNADDIAKACVDRSPLVAGRLMLQQLHELRACRETFVFETTLAAKSYARFLRDAQRTGYLVHIAYIWLSSVELAMKRVAVRVRRGGHDIPPADIERRYHRGLRNFFDPYRDLADAWTLCDNSGRKLMIVARGRKGGDATVLDQERFARICHVASTHP